MPKLPPGPNYTITVRQVGFQTAAIQVRIAVDTPLDISITLQKETNIVVPVIEESTTIDTLSVASTISLNKSLVDALPMPNGSITRVLWLKPLVSLDRKTQPCLEEGGQKTSIWWMEWTSPMQLPVLCMNLNEDAIEETQVLTAGLSADYGKVGGGVVNVVTRAGGNEFNGSLRYDVSNMSWNAIGNFAAHPSRLALVRSRSSGRSC